MCWLKLTKACCVYVGVISHRSAFGIITMEYFDGYLIKPCYGFSLNCQITSAHAIFKKYLGTLSKAKCSRILVRSGSHLIYLYNIKTFMNPVGLIASKYVEDCITKNTAYFARDLL